MENQEEKKVEETTGQETAQEEVNVEANQPQGEEVPNDVREIAKKIVAELPEHATIQKVDNGFIISIPGQKHRIANNLEEVVKHVSDIFAA
jgi:hypothetical protein